MAVNETIKMPRRSKPKQQQGESTECFNSRLAEWRIEDRAYMRAYNKARRAIDPDYVATAQRKAREWKGRNKPHVSRYRRKHYEEHKDQSYETARAWQLAHPDRKSEADKRYRIKHADKLKIKNNTPERKASQRERQRAYNATPEGREASRRRARENQKKRRAIDPAFRVMQNLRNQMSNLINTKRGRTMEIVGCDIAAFIDHIEAQFQPGMSWDNYGVAGIGKKVWNIDHIVPCAAFDFTDPAQQREAFHFKNLQPLWWEDNRRKWDRLDWVPESIKDAA